MRGKLCIQLNTAKEMKIAAVQHRRHVAASTVSAEASWQPGWASLRYGLAALPQPRCVTASLRYGLAALRPRCIPASLRYGLAALRPRCAAASLRYGLAALRPRCPQPRFEALVQLCCLSLAWHTRRLCRTARCRSFSVP